MNEVTCFCSLNLRGSLLCLCLCECIDVRVIDVCGVLSQSGGGRVLVLPTQSEGQAEDCWFAARQGPPLRYGRADVSGIEHRRIHGPHHSRGKLSPVPAGIGVASG